MVNPIPSQVTTEMAKREHRMAHYLWHGVRNSWARLSPAARAQIRKIAPEWQPPRPAVDRQGNVNRDNNSGEDFLYMHRQMIATVNGILTQVGDPGYPRVEGWNTIPAPGDSDYPVPSLAGLEDVKSDEYYESTLKPWEEQYKSAGYLGGVTLGQLGSDLEFTIHNDLHMRFASESPVGYRPNTAITRPVDPQWNAPAYDFLGDTYSSHVNSVFWKVHGWVDDRIEDWKKVHGVTGEIAWKGKWVGPMAHHHNRDVLAIGAAEPMPDTQRQKLETVAKILGEAGFTGFFRPRAKAATP